ncbi:hypothetical protein T265_13761, partial [Opisthorchis viverrini]
SICVRNLSEARTPFCTSIHPVSHVSEIERNCQHRYSNAVLPSTYIYQLPCCRQRRLQEPIFRFVRLSLVFTLGLSAPIKKFYKNVTISQVIPEGEQDLVYEVQLDKRKLRTPGGNTLLIPNEALALAVAVEWDSQKGTIKRHSMHLTNLCNRVLDWRSEIKPLDVVQSIMQYADTDTICFRVQEPDDLVHLQNASWDPVLHWVAEHYRIQPYLTNSLTGTPVMSSADRDILKQNLLGNTRWALIGKLHGYLLSLVS